jgi:hypothetical protein
VDGKQHALFFSTFKLASLRIITIAAGANGKAIGWQNIVGR